MDKSENTPVAPLGGPMVEKRVSKTVIRRRAQPEAETPVQAVVESVAACEPSPVEIVEASAPPVVEKPLTPSPPPAVEPPQKVTAPEAPRKKEEDGGYLPQYTRIRVVAASDNEPPPPPTLVRPADRPQDASGSGPSSLLASPGSIGLGRREIIEIRDFHKPKGGRKRRLAPGKKGKKTEITTPKAAKRVIRITDAVTVMDLAHRMSLKVNEVIAKLMGMGTMVTLNQSLDLDTASLVATEFGYEIENVAVAPEDLLVEATKQVEPERSEDVRPRAPIVTVMGHVDHGKTSLLDAIRKTNVASGEAGGITQHIGAYSVRTETGRTIAFIDTPGHEAFTAMRARGAKVTDIVVLVVAADDGVMPQTREAVSHARSANVPILVAVNKMDKPGADPDKIKKALTEYNLVPEEWGGETIYVSVSAKTGQGLPQLLEMLALQTDILELKANTHKRARGTVIEARLDKRRGSMITVLVQDGMLREGDVIVVGSESGRVRAMHDDRGGRIREAGPSTPVEVLGLAGIASSGDDFLVVADEKSAKQISELRKKAIKELGAGKTSKVSLDQLYQQIERGEVHELKVVIKADTTGSVEVLGDALLKLSTAKVEVKVIHGAVGGITENDVMLAAASGALVIGFHVRPDSSAIALAERQKVDVRLYEVIYELTEDVMKAMMGLLAPKKVEKRLGAAEVRQTFAISKVGTIAGCQVADGKVLRNAQVRLVRDGVAIYTGRLASLKRFKDDAREVPAGQECGIGIENFNDIKVGDVIESFLVEEIAPSLE